MSREVMVVYADQDPPHSWEAAVFLAGPSPRRDDVKSWRPEALDELRARWKGDGRLVVFVPERTDGAYDDYDGQVDWEERCLHLSDIVLFWVPREKTAMPAFTTNVEWGMWHDSGRVVFGAPPQAPGNRYLRRYAAHSGVPTATTLAGTVEAALKGIGAGASRQEGEREVPLLLWRTASFQSWYGAQRGAGNELRGARLVWSLRPAPGLLAVWALHVRMWIAAEDRIKANEVVISRPDVSMVVLYRPSPRRGETELVIVREFRSPATAPDGHVHELPGGSGPGDPLGVAVAEVAEETGLALDPVRLRAHGDRQLNATLTAHRAHLFSAEITETELAAVRAGGPYGVAADGEVTHVEVLTYDEVRAGRLVDWATLGMLAAVLAS